MKIKLSKPKGKTKKMAKGEWRYQVILILTLIIMMYPIVYMIGTSFKTLQDIFFFWTKCIYIKSNNGKLHTGV